MKNRKNLLLVLLLLLLVLVGYIQGSLYSPLTPKAAAITHFKINPKLLPHKEVVSDERKSPANLTESEIKEKHGRLELIRLIDNSLLRGVVIEQGADYIKVEMTSGIKTIPVDQVDTVEIVR